MTRYVFAAQELPQLLRQTHRQLTTGYLRIHLKAGQGSEATQTWLLAFLRGRLVFSADQPLTPKVFLKRLQRFVPRLQSPWAQRAIAVVQQRLMPNNTLAELIDGMQQLALLKPHDLEDALWLNLLTDMDRYLFDRAGTCRFEPQDHLYQDAPIAGFELEPVLQQAAERQDLWHSLAVGIPSMSAIPIVYWERFNRLPMTEEQRQKIHQLTDEGRSLEAIAAHLGRDRLEIAQMFASWVKKGLMGMHQPTPPQVNDTTPTILAVDDSIVVQEMLRQALPHYNVITSGQPADILNLMVQHRPDLLILDITMPGIDGLEICRMVRGLEQFRAIPIIILTGREGLWDRIKGKLSGATRYLSKPFNEVQLNYEIQKLLGQRSRSESGERPSSSAGYPVFSPISGF
ncbi:MAG: hypothetical protein OHK0012_02090 [Synechococcales cyanobacterium]